MSGPTQAKPTLFEPLAAFLERTAKLPEPTWLVPDLVPSGGKVLVVAQMSAGKHCFGLLVAQRAAAAGRTVFAVLEEGPARATGHRFRALRFGDAARVHVAHARGVLLSDRDVAEQLVTALRSHAEPVLILDPFTSVFGGADENSTAEMSTARARLDELARANPRALLFVAHHMGKRGHGMAASRGSTVLPAWCDVQLNLRGEASPRDGGRVVFTASVEKNRDGPRGQSRRVAIDLRSGEVSISGAASAKPTSTPAPSSSGSLL